MAIIEAPFDNEQELQDWVITNFDDFLPGTVFLPSFQITTVSGKRGVPDGFAFNFDEHEWYVIENELLTHGVWPHIAEQIVRFVVALQNPISRRKIRDRLFEALLATNKQQEVADILGTSIERLLQKLELFIEGVNPQVIIFIDDTNQDLHDMAHALAAQTRIFRVQKFLVNGQAEYYSPDRNVPVIVTDPSEGSAFSVTEFDMVDLLGGGQVEESVGRFKCFRMVDNSIIHVRRSKFYPAKNYYWYGIGATALGYCEQYGVTHTIFVMGEEGFAKVPMTIVKEFIANTKVSRNQDGSVRHYHCLISPGPEPDLFWSEEVPKFPLSEYYETF